MNYLAISELIVLLPALFVVVMATVSYVLNSNPTRTLFYILKGDVEQVAELGGYMVADWEDAALGMKATWTTVRGLPAKCADAFWSGASWCSYNLGRAIRFTAEVVGVMVAVFAAFIFFVVAALVAAAQKAASATTDTYRKARASLKVRILNWFGVTEMVNELKRENVKLQYSVRRLEILQQIEARDIVAQEEVNEMAEVLDAEFRTRLDALTGPELVGIWMNLNDDSEDLPKGRDGVTQRIMNALPGERIAAYKAARKQ